MLLICHEWWQMAANQDRHRAEGGWARVAKARVVDVERRPRAGQRYAAID